MTENKVKDKPNLYAYQDYRSYLNDAFAYLKATSSAFSFRFFSRASGIPSPGFIKLVLDGKRSIAADNVLKFAKGLKLNREESEYFESLVYFNQVEDAEQKKHYFDRMIRIRRHKNVRLLEADQFEYWSNWYCPAIREMILLPHFKEDPSWIADNLIPKITPAQARRTLELLERLSLVERGPEGRLVLRDASISSGAEVFSLAVTNYHKQMVGAALESIEGVRGKERDVSSVTIAVDPAQMDALKKEVGEFRRRLLALTADPGQRSERVYQLNVQLFPLTSKPRK